MSPLKLFHSATKNPHLRSLPPQRYSPQKTPPPVPLHNKPPYPSIHFPFTPGKPITQSSPLYITYQYRYLTKRPLLYNDIQHPPQSSAIHGSPLQSPSLSVPSPGPSSLIPTVFGHPSQSFPTPRSLLMPPMVNPRRRAISPAVYPSGGCLVHLTILINE